MINSSREEGEGTRFSKLLWSQTRLDPGQPQALVSWPPRGALLKREKGTAEKGTFAENISATLLMFFKNGFCERFALFPLVGFDLVISILRDGLFDPT